MARVLARRRLLVGWALLSVACGLTTRDPHRSDPPSRSAPGGEGTSGASGVEEMPGSGGNTAFGPPSWDFIDGAIPPPEELCEMTEARLLEPCSMADHQALLVGRWWLCEGTFIIASAGLEFTPDFKWYALHEDESGAIVRGSGFDGEGTWEFVDTTDWNGACSIQVTMHFAVGYDIFETAFSDEPRKLLMRGTADTPRYVAIP
jgi:hypothetical protein